MEWIAHEGFFCFCGDCLASSFPDSVLGTVIKPLARLLNRSKESGGSSQFLGGFMRLVFFTYTFLRCPRFWRGSTLPLRSLMVRFALYFLARQLDKRETFASKSRSRFHEPISIRSLARIEPKSLLIEISKQVKRFDANIRSLEASLEKRPEVFNSVRVNLTVNILLSVIDYVVNVFILKFVVAGEHVGINRRTSRNVPADCRINVGSVGSVNNLSADLASVTIQQAHYRNLANMAFEKRSLAEMEVTRRTADESFVNFDLARQLCERTVLHCLADAMKQKPRALLRDAKRAMKFKRANAVLSVRNQPDSAKPLVESDRRIFHQRPNLDRELSFRVLRVALPDLGVLKVGNVLRAATRTGNNAIRPAERHQELAAVIRIREVNDCLLKRFGEVLFAFHAVKVA